LAQIKNSSSLENARRVALEQLPTAEVLIPPMANLNQLKRIIYENLGAAMVGNKTVDQALQDAEQVWNDNLKG
jgi:putative chitobiose transport system substrate-binding protein